MISLINTIKYQRPDLNLKDDQSGIISLNPPHGYFESIPLFLSFFLYYYSLLYYLFLSILHYFYSLLFLFFLILMTGGVPGVGELMLPSISLDSNFPVSSDNQW